MPPLPDIEAAKKITAKIREIVRFLRHSQKETIAIFVGIFIGSAAWWLSKTDWPDQFDLIKRSDWKGFKQYIALLLLVLSGAFIVWACVRIWRQLVPPPDEESYVGPSAIKGPMAFGPHDGDLFRRLGREAELAALLDRVLDDQVSLVVIMGESGSGKTSLLRAGLPAILERQNPPIEYHYWEAIPDRAVAGVLNAIQTGWATVADAPAPQKLADLYTPTTSNARRVIVLDQFEQLSPGRRLHQPIFQLLRNIVMTAMPPHRTTYIIAFRRDYAPTWLDFEHEQLADHRQSMVSLRLFSEDPPRMLWPSLRRRHILRWIMPWWTISSSRCGTTKTAFRQSTLVSHCSR
jgi:hypothetical protein